MLCLLYRLYESAKARLEAEAAEAAEQQRILDLLYQVQPAARVQAAATISCPLRLVCKQQTGLEGWQQACLCAAHVHDERTVSAGRSRTIRFL